MKHLYRALIFLAVFAGSVFLFSGNVREVQVNSTKKKVELAEPSFPTMIVKSQGYNINLLRGYNSNLKANVIRESMTPIGMDKEFQLVITENKVNVRKLKYELRRVNNNELMDSGEISVLEDSKEGKVATIKVNAGVEQGKEYAFKVTAVSTEGKKIHYFTRVKYYGTDCFLDDKMNFAMDFHNKTLDKSKVDSLSRYLEYSSTKKNDNFADVDIHSSIDVIGWGELKPEIVSKIVPTIKELNIETLSVSIEYLVKIHSGDGEEICRAKEFYRVRYSSGRAYLLKFNRTMETVFNIKNTSLSENEFKVGITDNSDIEMLYTEEKNRVAFAIGGELWEYYLTENIATKVFSFWDSNPENINAAYNQHGYRIINLNENGDMDFMVYGYMNRGDYEGCVGIVLYKYYDAEKRIEEQLFIPLETTYQILKENLDHFCYVNGGNVFYFSISNVIYSYDTVAKKMTVIAKQVADGDYCYVEGAGLLAWQGNSNDAKSKEILLMDLESKSKISLDAKEGERIILIGTIDDNIVYGQVKDKDLSEDSAGTKVTPMYKVSIVDKTGKELKVYQEKNIYVTNAEIIDDVIQMERVKKQNGKFVDIKGDSIQNKNGKVTPAMGVNKRVTQLNLTEYYLYLRQGFIMESLPSVSNAKSTMINENMIVRLQGNESKYARYYVYAEGIIKGSYSNLGKAMNAAEEWMGVVINEDNQLIYERSGKYTNNQIGSIQTITAKNGVNAKGACVAMILKHNHVAADEKELSKSNKTAYALLKSELKDAKILSMKGCTLDEVLYFVSNNRPVIGCLGANNFVLITEYNESTVTYINPSAGKKETKSIAAATKMFKDAGNVYISYVQ